MEFRKEDIAQIERRGVEVSQVEQQISLFKKGNIFVNIKEAATVKSGINVFSEEEQQDLIHIFNSKKEEKSILKFVPASGAATRMFKALFKFLKEFNAEEEALNDFLERKNNETLLFFFHNLEKLPFYTQVEEKLQQAFPNYKNDPDDKQKLLFVKVMLEEEYLNFSALPKGLVPFHKYPDHLRTAFEEHLYEATQYATSRGVAKIHFTVLENHLAEFEQHLKEIQPKIEAETNTKLEVTFSFQNPKTDTIAVDLEDKPFRKEDGSILFRPGGHGALIENLNAQEADLIFIKNIDNVVVPRFNEQMINFKKVLGGKLIQLQNKVFSMLKKLEEGEISEVKLEEMFNFMQKELNSGLSYDLSEMSSEEIIELLQRKLNRPIRVCGIVKNEGEPGGGPFWVNQKDGEISLQIVEGAQIDKENYQQSKIVQEATHFNPVDIVCGVKDACGNIFDFKKFIDPNTSFIAHKTSQGKELKALEHPGLWNGAMANWITVFVEVPVETFNPVKTVADLLKPKHQVRL